MALPLDEACCARFPAAALAALAAVRTWRDVAILAGDNLARLAGYVGARGLFVIIETQTLLLMLSARYPDVQQRMHQSTRVLDLYPSHDTYIC